MSKYRNTDITQWAQRFDALSNPNRLRLWLRLLEGNCCSGEIENTSGSCTCIGELALGLNLAPSTISHHIKELRVAGLIQIKRCGQRAECWIDPEILRDMAGFFDMKVNCPQETK